LQIRGAGRKSRIRSTLAMVIKPNGKYNMKSSIPLFVFRIIILSIIGCVWTSRANTVHLNGFQADDITICEYDSKNVTNIDAQIHAGRFFTDYERHGFFRIGLLPIPVLENIQIKIRSAGCLTNALLGIHIGNKPSPGVRRIEFRNFEITSLDEQQPRLSARLARFGRDGNLELFDVSIITGTGEQTRISKANLQISNPSAGLVNWNSEGRLQSLFLFKPMAAK